MSYNPAERHKVTTEHFIHIYVIMYRKFTLSISDIRSPTLKSRRITSSKECLYIRFYNTPISN